jgi:hypothetical protein
MEKWFAIQLFSTAVDGVKSSEYEQTLRQWLSRNGQDEQIKLLEQRRRSYSIVKIFSLLAGSFMGYGTIYLLVEAFGVIPFLATIPAANLAVLIFPMAIIAGAAYGFLAFNAVTDMINNDTIRKWYYKITENINNEGYTPRNIFIASTAVLLLILAFALTACTAGTWWTIVQNTPPLFAWMRRVPSYVTGCFNPLITGISSLVFNLENTSESLEMIIEITKPASPKEGESEIISSPWRRVSNAFRDLRQRENWLQIINLPRLLITIILTPLRACLFLGHLISIAVTANRVPRIPEMASASLGFISEGFEDAHYFLKHEHQYDHSVKGLLEERFEADHDHNTDLPTRLLKLIFFPLYAVATIWDLAASQFNQDERRLTLTTAWDKQTGQPSVTAVNLQEDMVKPSDDWRKHQACYSIERFKEKHLSQVALRQSVAQKKSDRLTELQHSLHNDGERSIETIISEEAQQPVYKMRRSTFGFFSSKKTSTEEFLDELSHRVAPSAT